MAPKMLLVALVLACAATASVSAQKLCTCPDTTVCEGAPSSCGSPPGLSLAFAIGPIQRLYGYSTKKSGVADAAACRAFCGANSYYEYVSVAGPSLGPFIRRPAGDCVCYNACKNYAYWINFPTAKLISGYTNACTVPA